MCPLVREIPLEAEVPFRTSLGIGRYDRHEQCAFANLPANLPVPSVPAPAGFACTSLRREATLASPAWRTGRATREGPWVGRGSSQRLLQDPLLALRSIQVWTAGGREPGVL